MERSTIGVHPRRKNIDLLLAARVRQNFICETFGLSKSAVSRYKMSLQRHERSYFAALKRHVRELNLDRRHLMEMSASTGC